MAALEAAVSTFCLYTLRSSLSLKSLLCPRSQSFTKLQTSSNAPTVSLHSHIPPVNLPRKLAKKLSFEPCRCSAVEVAEAEAEEEENKQPSGKKKLFVANLPWSYSVADIKNLFGQCGTVKSVEIIKHKNKLSRGYAFVTMESGEEAQAVVDKYNSQELSGRIIKVEFAKRLSKPSPPASSSPPPGLAPGETRHKIYVSNLQWKVRSKNLKEFFSEKFNPVSARVVFDSPSGKSAGYGFVSFATKEEAEAAISELNGKELMGRSVLLRFSQKEADKSGSQTKEEDTIEGQPE